jgi:putative transposase
MLSVGYALLAHVVSTFRSWEALRLEYMALRHRVAVYQRTVRPRLQPTDRLFWAWLTRLWAGWQEALVFVQPRSIPAWQRQQFCDRWRRVSQQGKPGRPAIAKEVRDLIREMSRANPMWGSPRVLGGLQSPIQPPANSRVIAVPEVGGLHHHDERQAA